MIDMSNIGRDFLPRRRPEEGMPGVGSPMGQQQPFTPPSVPPPQALPPGVGAQWGGQVGTGQQPLTPIGNMPPPPVTPSGPGTFTDAPGMLQTGTGSLQGGMPPPGVPPPQELVGQGSIASKDYDIEQPGYGGAGQPGTSVQPGEGGFPYPEQWQQAGDIYGQLAGGMPGMPDPSAIWGGYQQQAGDLSRELAEQAGMGVGGRYGSALQRNIADVGMRAGERFGGEMERMRMGDVAGQRQAMLGAASGLGGLGGQYAQLPGQLAGQAMGLGGQYQQMQNIPLQAQYQEFMRTQPEYSPYLPYMQQGAQVPYGPATYGQGFGSSMMDIGSMLGMYGMMGGG